MSNIYKGNVDVRETSESGQIVKADVETRTIVKEGKYSALAAVQPSKGADYYLGPGQTNKRVVSSATLVRKHGGMGKLTIVLAPFDSSSTEVPHEITVTYTVDMAQIEKPIEAHADFKAYADQIRKWNGSPSEVRFAANPSYVDTDGTVYQLGGMALKAAQLMMKGVQSYLVFAPVARVVTVYDRKPTGIGGNTGKICSPPSGVTSMLASRNPAWVWLKTADNAAKNGDGTYTRTEEWTASDEWSTDLYKSA